MNDPGTPGNGLTFNAAHLPILERYGGKRGHQALALIAAGQMAAPVVKYAWKKYRQRDDFTITVPGTDDIYPDLHDWVLERISEDERKALIATSVSNHYASPSVYGGDSDSNDDTPQLKLRYDGSRKQSVVIEGHEVTVAVEREDIPDRVNLPDNWRQYMEKITFTAATSLGRNAVVRMIEGLLADKRNAYSPPALYIPSRYGGDWIRRGDLPTRSVESIILKPGQLESLTTDLEKFLNDEDEYNRLSQPWHRGYCFYGVPGTGKTSVARALASHFDLPTYYLPLGDIDKDTNLTSLVASVQPRSVLLLEDVDVYHAATERSEEKGKASIAAMLNALDGVWTPHGLITIMTTNNRDVLDDAMVRAGRVDVDEEFTSLDLEQAKRIAEFFDLPDFDVREFVGVSPAELIESLKRERNELI